MILSTSIRRTLTWAGILLWLATPGNTRAEEQTSSLKEVVLPRGATAIFHAGSLAGYWQAWEIVFHGNTVLRVNGETIINVWTVPKDTELNLLVLSRAGTVTTPKESLRPTYRLLREDGAVLARWSPDHPADADLPYTLPTRKWIILLYPESQSYRCYSYTGELLAEEHLFHPSSWDHERILLAQETTDGKVILVGMRSPALTAPENVAVFTIDPATLKPVFQTDLWLTLPYFLETAPTGRIAILGTRATGREYEQKTVLHLLQPDFTPLAEPTRYPTVPKKLVWSDDRLIAVTPKHLLLTSIANPVETTSIPLPYPDGVPLGLFTSREEIHLLAGDGIDYLARGFRYRGLRWIRYNPATGRFITRTLSTDSFVRFNLTVSADRSVFGIQLDEHVTLYRIP
jgi:hypothetical protein